MRHSQSTLFVIAALAASLTVAQEARVSRATGGAATKPIAGMEWLIGGVWTADASMMGNGMKRIETRYQWSDNSSFIRFNTHFVSDKADMKTYDGNFFWYPSRQTLAMWYTDTTGSITEGPVTINGDLMEMTFSGTNFQGKPADLRVQVKRKNNDLYTWSLAERDHDSWKALASLDYARK